MMKLKRVSTLVLALVCFVCSVSPGFIPPLTALISESFEGRSPASTEFVWKHQIVTDDEKVTEVEERWINDRGRALLVWKDLSNNQSLMASWEKGSYVFKDKKVPSACATFVNYFLSTSGEEFKETAVSENYIRRDQLLQYQPGFDPTGDPLTWKIRENYMAHDDIFLSRWPHGIFFTFEGTSEGNTKRSLLFQREQAMLTGIRNEQNGLIQGWNFSTGTKFPGAGYFPRVMTFDYQGKERVRSDLMQVRTVRDRALADVKSNWRNPSERQPLNDSWESLLKVLLAFR